MRPRPRWRAVRTSDRARRRSRAARRAAPCAHRSGASRDNPRPRRPRWRRRCSTGPRRAAVRALADAARSSPPRPPTSSAGLIAGTAWRASSSASPSIRSSVASDRRHRRIARRVVEQPALAEHLARTHAVHAQAVALHDGLAVDERRTARRGGALHDDVHARGERAQLRRRGEALDDLAGAPRRSAPSRSRRRATRAPRTTAVTASRPRNPARHVRVDDHGAAPTRGSSLESDVIAREHAARRAPGSSPRPTRARNADDAAEHVPRDTTTRAEAGLGDDLAATSPTPPRTGPERRRRRGWTARTSCVAQSRAPSPRRRATRHCRGQPGVDDDAQHPPKPAAVRTHPYPSAPSR